MADKIKIVLALLCVLAGLAGFYLLGESAGAVRILVVLAGLAVGAAIALTSEMGRGFVSFAREAVVEAKKVVWPGRKETMQTTGIVFVFVVIMAVFLWLTDKSLEWVLYHLILGWK